MEHRTIIQGEDLLIETEFFSWLKERRNKGISDTNFVPTIKEYMHGVEAPFKGRKDLPAHKYVFDCFWDKIHDNTI